MSFYLGDCNAIYHFRLVENPQREKAGDGDRMEVGAHMT